jgi:hypothetical protein
VVAISIDTGLPEFLNWVKESTALPEEGQQ